MLFLALLGLTIHKRLELFLGLQPRSRLGFKMLTKSAPYHTARPLVPHCCEAWGGDHWPSMLKCLGFPPWEGGRKERGKEREEERDNGPTPPSHAEGFRPALDNGFWAKRSQQT